MVSVVGIVLAIVANFFWSLVNIIDKYLVSRFCLDGNIGSLLILSSLFPATLMPFALYISRDPFIFTPPQYIVLILSGLLMTGWMYFYFKALFNDDVSSVIALFQLTPVFALLLAFLFLREIPTIFQIFWAGVVIMGAMVVSYENGKGRVRYRLIGYLAAASVLVASTNILFKMVALPDTFWQSLFWQSAGTVLAGCLLFVFHSSFRSQFLYFIKRNVGVGLTLNALNESLVLVGNVIFLYATLFAPLAVIQSMQAYQPVFVLFLGILIGYISPSFKPESMSSSVFIQKIAGVLLIVLGSSFLI